MKKYIYIVLAAAAFASCSQDDAIEMNRQEIGFGEAFVENATRVMDANDYSGTKLLEGFKVYGTVTGNANTLNLFQGVEIVRPTNGQTNAGDWNAVWKYKNDTDKEYWVSGCDYSFAAIVDGTVPNDGYSTTGMPTKINYSLGTGDLLYATATADTKMNGAPTNNGLVSFTFTHLLSKVYFSVVDNFSTQNNDYKYEISDITVSGIPTQGVYTVGSTVNNGTWAKVGDNTVSANTPLNFGKATEDYLIIPVEQTMTVKFSYDVLFKGQKISTILVEKPLTYEFAQKTVYNIQVTLPTLGNEIQFTVQAMPQDAWANGGSPNITL